MKFRAIRRSGYLHGPEGQQDPERHRGHRVVVRLFNGTPKVKSDDTVVNLANVNLRIKRA